MADQLAVRTGLGKSVAKEAGDGVFAAIGDALANGEQMRIAVFGTFGARSRPARTGRNLRTGEAVSISALTSPTFRAGKTLKDAVNARSRVVALQGQRTATDDDSDRLHAEFSRLICDDGPSASCRTGAAKTQGSPGSDGWTAGGMDAASRIKQGDSGLGSN